jgi:hypothetical protein
MPRGWFARVSLMLQHERFRTFHYNTTTNLWLETCLTAGMLLLTDERTRTTLDMHSRLDMNATTQLLHPAQNSYTQQSLEHDNEQHGDLFLRESHCCRCNTD